MTPIWYRLLSHLKRIGGVSPSMLYLIQMAGVDPCHGYNALINLADRQIIKLGPGGKYSRPIQLLVDNSDEWLDRIYQTEDV